MGGSTGVVAVVRVRVSYDEWYPVYSVEELAPPMLDGSDHYYVALTVSRETFDRWERISSEFGNMQDELRQLHDKHRKPR
jgi:hypothetical protein